MRGWIILAALVSILYYLYTETNELDEPIAKTQALIKKIEHKLDAMTGTQIILIDSKLQSLKPEISHRLSETELAEFDALLQNKGNLMQFKDVYCAGSSLHPVFNRDNLQFICDRL